MRCLILAALIGFCAASALYPGGHQIVFADDDHVFVHGIHGNSYGFTHLPEQHHIDIVINSEHSPAKHIQINGQTCQIVQLQGFHNLPWQFQQHVQGPWGGEYQNHLFHVLRQYQGIVSEHQYQQLLQTIHNHVEQGHICHIVYHLLSVLDQLVDEQVIAQYIQGQHHTGVNTVFPVHTQGLQGVQQWVGQGVHQGVHPIVQQWLNQWYPSWNTGAQDWQHHYGGVHHYGLNPVTNAFWGVHQGAGVGNQWVHNVYPQQYQGVGTNYVWNHLLGNQYQGPWQYNVHQQQGYVHPWFNHWNANAIVGY